MLDGQEIERSIDELMWRLRRQVWLYEPLPNDFNVASIATPFKERLGDGSASQGLTELPGPGGRDGRAARTVAQAVERTRAGLAELLNAEPECIFLGQSATHCVRRLVNGMPGGGVAIVSDAEFSAVVYVIAKHLTVVRVRSGPALAQNVERAITPATRLILASYVTHDSCEVQPIAEVIELGQRRTIPVIVDAAQAVGQIPVDVGALRPAALVGSGHKWLRSRVSGFAYVNPAFFGSSDASAARLRDDDEVPDHLTDGWGEQLSHLGNTLTIWRDEIGWQRVFARIQEVGGYARTMLSENPSVARIRGTAPGMISFCTNTDPYLTASSLRAQGIHLSIKPSGWLRVAISPFTSRAEIEFLSRCIARACERLPHTNREPVDIDEIPTQDLGLRLQGRTVLTQRGRNSG